MFMHPEASFVDSQYLVRTRSFNKVGTKAGVVLLMGKASHTGRGWLLTW